MYARGGTIEKCTKKLKNGENVVIFLNKDKESNGIYHIIKNSSCKVVLVNKKVVSNITNPKLKNNFIAMYGMKYEIMYQEWEKSKNMEMSDYMDSLRQNLYSNF